VTGAKKVVSGLSSRGNQTEIKLFVVDAKRLRPEKLSIEQCISVIDIRRITFIISITQKHDSK
jgi:hypothetical protein